MVSSVLIEQIPVATTAQLSKQPRRLQVGFEEMSHILGIEAGGVERSSHRSGTCTRQHVDVDAIPLKDFQHPKMSHAASCAASECQTNPNASQMMHDAFEPVLQ